jgi:hypothetical protein
VHAPVATPKGWACSACTFINKDNGVSCFVCTTPRRPVSAVGAAGAPAEARDGKTEVEVADTSTLSEVDDACEEDGKQEVGEGEGGQQEWQALLSGRSESEWAEDPASAGENRGDADAPLLDGSALGLSSSGEGWSELISAVHAVSSEHMMHHIELTKRENPTHPHLVTVTALPGDTKSPANYAGLALKPPPHTLGWSRLPADLAAVLRGVGVAVMEGRMDGYVSQARHTSHNGPPPPPIIPSCLLHTH